MTLLLVPILVWLGRCFFCVARYSTTILLLFIHQNLAVISFTEKRLKNTINLLFFYGEHVYQFLESEKRKCGISKKITFACLEFF